MRQPLVYGPHHERIAEQVIPYRFFTGGVLFTPPMKHVSSLMYLLMVAAACTPQPSYKTHPLGHTVNVDDIRITVVPQSGNVWVAHGGEDVKDGYVQYRQKRAIEVASRCRISRVFSKPSEPLLKAKVRCGAQQNSVRNPY